MLATPIEEILANPPDAPRGRPIARRSARRARIGPRAAARRAADRLRASAAGSRARLTEAGAKARRQVLAAPAMPLTPFPPQPPRPGSALSVGYSSGDLAVGAVGTVAYVDGDRVWGFGHPFENCGLRSLLLQDAYVYAVISNPNVGRRHRLDLQARRRRPRPRHDLQRRRPPPSSAARARRPPTVPVRVFSEDEDTGARSTLGARVVDETDAGTPTGGSALSFVAPLAVAQGASAILRSAPGKLSGTVCMRITLRERKRPLRFCNRYMSAHRAVGPGGGREHRRRRRRLRRARRR